MIAPACPHRSADPRMCPDCRQQRITGRPALTLVPSPLADPGEPDYAQLVRAEMRRVLDQIGWAGLPKDHLRALLRAALAGAPPHTDVILSTCQALEEEPALYLTGAIAVPLPDQGSDHGNTPTPLTQDTG
ncbi:hypothetical protein MF672_010725 [Actinomadura sp. ATCC 31491]|uniref:Uncharacterized protein n=1 Tax=Actinomadura luzonensis TaxID=2805427 RepID=A0ABT0FQH1_9ACTN|nr:hypothetical protein [Actinomadura luzonensis]MCK2214260.1 hypothetical protein [Actinomadura luzonensis]